MKNIVLLHIFIFTICVNILYAGNTPKVQNFINHKDWSFVENKGQLAAPNPLKGANSYDLLSDIKYYSHEGGAHIYCRPGTISFVFTKIINEQNDISEATGTSMLSPAGGPVRMAEPGGGRGWKSDGSNQNSTITSNRIDLILLNANKNALITPSDQQQYYENFYLAHTPEEGITNVHTYKTITYNNIYPHIDMVLHCKENSMKYEFVVWPGGKVNDIQLQWNGLGRIKKLKDSKILYSFPLGNMTETVPYTYTENVGAGFTPAQFQAMYGADIEGDRKGRSYTTINSKLKIESRFVLKNNRIGFKVGNYDRRKVLVVDPTLIWSTFFGGGKEWWTEGGGIAIDDRNDVYITGSTSSTSDVASSGAFQTIFGGNTDVFVAKFSTSGAHLWSTYYGGNQQDEGYGIVADLSRNVYITGSTISTSGIASSKAYKTSLLNGKFNAFIAKFNSNGTRNWSTYFGGDNAGGNCITADASGNIAIAGNTNSPGLATNGTYQTAINGSGDAYIVKFSSVGNPIWCTYFGGNNGDYPNGIAIDSSSNIIITGNTSSTSGIASNGAYQTKYLGGINGDAFIAKFSLLGNRLWSTYYGGSGQDGGSGIAVDKFSNIYITGLTTSTNSIASNGAFKTSLSGASDAYIAKFSANGNRLWSTYIGGNKNDASLAIATDHFGNVFIIGSTESDSGVASSGSFQTRSGGFTSDAFVSGFSSTGKLFWSTYFGGSGAGGYGITTDTASNICITGVTSSSTGITTSGSYQDQLIGGQDAFVAKFSQKFIDDDIGMEGFYVPNDSICKGQNNSIVVILKNFGHDSIISANVFWRINSKLTGSKSITNVKIPLGGNTQIILSLNNLFNEYDTITVWAHLTNGIDTVKQNDTVRKVVYYYSRHFAGVGDSSYTICKGAHLKIGTSGYANNTYLWSSEPKGFISTLSNPIINPDSFTTFYLTETNIRTGCKNTDSSKVTVKIIKAPVADAGKSHPICIGDSTLIGSNYNPNLDYSWSSIPIGFMATQSILYVKPSFTTIYTLKVTNSTGCSDINDDTISVDAPKALAGVPQSICSGTIIQLGAHGILGNKYSWISSPHGYVSTLSNPVDSPKINTTYYLTETSATGCHKTDSVLITVAPKPIVKIQTDSIDAFSRKFSAINPNYPAYNYKWSFSDSDTASGYSIMHTFKKEGNYTINLKVWVPGYCTDSDFVNVNIHPPFSLDIFPNPFSTKSDIRYILTNPAHIKIGIVDMIGRDIGTLVNTTLSSGEYHNIFDAAALRTRPGMYLVVFMMDDKIITKKIVQLESIFY